MAAPLTIIDYAFGQPTPSALKAAGVQVVCRYVGPAGWGKTIQEPEAAALVEAGIGVVLVFEQGATDAAGGFAAGAANARLALANIPPSLDDPNRPIYMAVDEAVSGTMLTTALAYIQGAASVLGPELTGDYGEGLLCQATEWAGYASWHWQSASASFPGNAATLGITAIQQHAGASPIPGTDLDTGLFADVGQRPNPTAAPGSGDFPLAVASALDPVADGSWVVGSDGGVFCTGSAGYFGSLHQLNPKLPPGGTNAATPSAPIVAIVASGDGLGYWMLGADGGVYAFGDAGFYGSYPGLPPAEREGSRSFGGGGLVPTVGGYVLTSLDGESYHFPVGS